MALLGADFQELTGGIDLSTDAVQILEPTNITLNTTYNLPVTKKPRYIIGTVRSSYNNYHYIYQFIQDVFNNKYLSINIISPGSASNTFNTGDGLYGTLQSISDTNIVYKSTNNMLVGLTEVFAIY